MRTWPRVAAARRAVSVAVRVMPWWESRVRAQRVWLVRAAVRSAELSVEEEGAEGRVLRR